MRGAGVRIDVPAAGGALREAALHRLAEKEGGLGVCLAARTLGPALVGQKFLLLMRRTGHLRIPAGEERGL
jgi:hypothetical protein